MLLSSCFSEQKLGNISSHIDGYVDAGKFPGVLCLVVRHGEEAFFHAYGKRDMERDIDITRDTVFRIYSMTKPITSVALMMLYEQGCFQLDDPQSAGYDEHSRHPGRPRADYRQLLRGFRSGGYRMASQSVRASKRQTLSGLKLLRSTVTV